MKIDKVWGYEIWVVNSTKYCGKRLILNKGWRCSLHYHKVKDETFLIASGKVLMEVNGGVFVMNPGDSIRVKPLTHHRFGGLEDSEIIEFSTHHEENDSYRVELSGRMPDGLHQNAT